MNWLNIHNIHKHFGQTEVLHGISFEAKKGEIIALLGRSGSGKTTLLRILAGLEDHDQGEIHLQEKALTASTEKRGIGMVFQEYALFPHMSVEKNVGFGIKDKAAKKARTAEMLQMVGLSEYGARFPHELSGGQQQRVAIARALAPDPALLLLDEPFSNLDASLRHSVRKDISDLLKKNNTTAIFVTHDIGDALAVADKIVVLAEGKNVRTGTPQELFSQPGHTEVASLFGHWNVLDFKSNGETALGTFQISNTKSTDQHLSFPFDAVQFTETNGKYEGIVKYVQFAGLHYEVMLECAKLEIVAFADVAPATGETIQFNIDESAIQTF